MGKYESAMPSSPPVIDKRAVAMAVTEEALLFHAPPSTSNLTVLLLHARSPILHFHCRPISVSDHRFLLLFRQRSLHIRRCRRWDSNAETYSSKNFNSDDSDETEKLDGEMEQWVEALDDYIDSIWIFKVLGSYGWMLPPIIISLLLVNGLKAFLLALSLPILQSTFAFAIERFQNRGKIRPGVRRSKQKGKAKRRRSRVYGSRDAAFEESTYRRGMGKKRRGYESWFSKDGGSNGRSSGDFGGWDELDSESDRNVGSFSRRSFEKSRGTSRRKGEGRESDGDGPLLLRLLLSAFPFLSSWTRWL